MLINILSEDNNDDDYYSAEFLQVIEDHLPLFRAQPLQYIEVSKHQTYKYEGDLYGLFNELRINKRYHYAIMRLNNYKSSLDYKGDREVMLTIDTSIIDQLLILLQTKK